MPALMKSPTDQTTHNSKASPQRLLAKSKWGRRVGSFIFLGLATALHGLAFVVPWPDAEPVEAPEVVLEPELPAISTSQLPPGAPEPKSQATEAAAKSALPNQAAPARQASTNRPDPSPQKLAAEAAETEETNESGDTENPNIGDLPPETGLGQSTGGDPLTVPSDPLTAPSLEERLQDPTAYVKDGEPTGQRTISISAIPAWTTLIEGQLGFLPPPITLHPVEFSVDYALNCQEPLSVAPEKGTLGIVLGESNEILMGPDTLGTSGYSLFDEQAEEQVQHQDIIEQITATKSEPRPGYFILEFTVNTDASNCPSP